MGTGQRYLFVHLSDIHFREGMSCPVEKVSKIFPAITRKGNFTCVFFLITGDLAFSGCSAEYELANFLIEAIKTEAVEHEINAEVLFVPGNHDIIRRETTYESIAAQIKHTGKDRAYQNELALMDSFFELADRHHCFTSSRVFSSHTLPQGLAFPQFEFTLLNSAPFSTLQPTDKELHFLPHEAIDALYKSSSKNIKIVLCHHAPDCFEDESRRFFENLLIKNCDILFVGHEHSAYSETRNFDNRGGYLMIRGGEFHPNTFDSSEINLLALDLGANMIEKSRFHWDKQGLLFCEDEEPQVSSFMRKAPNSIVQSSSYINTLNKPIDYLGLTVEEVFVFPEFKLSIGTAKKRVQNDQVNSEDDLWRMIRDKRIICICGGSNSGKTTLLSHLYRNSYEQDFTPLIIANDFRFKGYKHSIKSLIREQYGESDINVSEFDQVPIENKLILIDDYDCLEGKGKDGNFFEKLLQEFGHIVITQKRVPEQSFVDQIKAELEDEDYITSIEIKDFYKAKRTALIESICERKDAPNGVADDIVSIIDAAVNRHRRLYDLSPDFVTRCVNFFLENGTKDKAEEASFSDIYSYSIKKLLYSAFESTGHADGRKIDAYMILLCEVAEHMHRNKEETISYPEFTECIDAYCKEYRLQIKPGEVEDIARGANILIRDNSTFGLTFASVSYLAFFVAKWIDYELMRNRDVEDTIRYLIKYACFSINENILVFLSYLRTNASFPLVFCELAMDMFSDEPEVSFDDGNITCLQSIFSSGVNRMPSQQDKEKLNEELSRVEEETDPSHFEYAGPYDYSEEDAAQLSLKIDCVIKYISIAGKSLVSLNEILDGTSKDLIIEALYSATNRVLYQIIKPLDNSFEEAADEIFNQIAENNGDASKEEIKNRMRILLLVICLALYDRIGFDSSSPDSIKMLLDYASDSTNSRIQKLSFAANAYKPEAFLEYASKLIQDAYNGGNIIEIESIQAISRLYLLQHRGIPHNVMQGFVKRIFFKDKDVRMMKQNRELEGGA